MYIVSPKKIPEEEFYTNESNNFNYFPQDDFDTFKCTDNTIDTINYYEYFINDLFVISLIFSIFDNSKYSPETFNTR